LKSSHDHHHHHYYSFHLTFLLHPPTYPPTTHHHIHHHIHQAHEEALSATESTPAAESLLRFYASSGDEARLTALLERGIVNVMATDEVGGWVDGWA